MPKTKKKTPGNKNQSKKKQTTNRPNALGRRGNKKINGSVKTFYDITNKGLLLNGEAIVYNLTLFKTIFAHEGNQERYENYLIEHGKKPEIMKYNKIISNSGDLKKSIIPAMENRINMYLSAHSSTDPQNRATVEEAAKGIVEEPVEEDDEQTVSEREVDENNSSENEQVIEQPKITKKTNKTKKLTTEQAKQAKERKKAKEERENKIRESFMYETCLDRRKLSSQKMQDAIKYLFYGKLSPRDKFQLKKNKHTVRLENDKDSRFPYCSYRNDEKKGGWLIPDPNFVFALYETDMYGLTHKQGSYLADLWGLKGSNHASVSQLRFALIGHQKVIQDKLKGVFDYDQNDSRFKEWIKWHGRHVPYYLEKERDRENYMERKQKKCRPDLKFRILYDFREKQYIVGWVGGWTNPTSAQLGKLYVFIQEKKNGKWQDKEKTTPQVYDRYNYAIVSNPKFGDIDEALRNAKNRENAPMRESKKKGSKKK